MTFFVYFDLIIKNNIASFLVVLIIGKVVYLLFERMCSCCKELLTSDNEAINKLGKNESFCLSGKVQQRICFLHAALNYSEFLMQRWKMQFKVTDPFCICSWATILLQWIDNFKSHSHQLMVMGFAYNYTQI